MNAALEADVLGPMGALLSQGHALFALKRGAKVPANANGHTGATTDAAQLLPHFERGGRFEGHNYGVRGGTAHTLPDGRAAKLLIVDLDIREDKDGLATLKAACEVAGVDVHDHETFAVKTPNGMHLYYWDTDGVAHGVDVLGPGSGVDTRTELGYVVGPGSVVDGKRYEVANPGTPIRPLGAMAAIFRRKSLAPRKKGDRKPRVGVDSARAEARAVAYLKTAPRSVKGQGGDATAFKVAARLKDEGCTRVQALDLMLSEHWDGGCGWSADRLSAKVDNAYGYGQDQPGSAAPEAVFSKVDAAPPKGRTLLTTCVADVEAKPIAWLWPQVLALGKHSTVAGDPGLGKSQFSIWLAAVVSTGGTLPDGSTCPQGSVILITAEDDIADTIRPRLEAAGADLKRIHVVDGVPAKTSTGQEGMRGFDITTDVHRLAEMIDGLPDLRLIVIDPLSAFMGNTDSHKTAEVRGAMNAICKLAESRRAALLSVNHLNKNAKAGAMARVTGSGALVAQPRAVYIVTRDKTDQQLRVLAPLKNNIGNDSTAYYFRVVGCDLPGGIGTSRIEWQERTEEMSADEALEAKPTRGTGEAEARAAEFLRDQLKDGARNAEDMMRAAAEAGIAKRTLRRAREALSVIAKKETGSKHGAWTWSLPRTAGEIFS